MPDRKSSTPPLSFIIPAYNASGTLLATLESVQRQTRDDWEAIVVDDGSTDDTVAIASSFGDERVRLLRQENHGLAGARNAGLRHARGEFVAFLDADDRVRPEFAEQMLHAIGEADAVACWYELVGPIGEDLGWVCRTMRSDLSWSRLLRSNPLAVTVVVRRESLVRLVGRVDAFDESLRVLEDWDLWLRMAQAGAAWAPMVEEPLVQVRLSRGSLSQSVERMHAVGLQVIARYACEEEDRQDARRHWDLQHTARFMACGDGSHAASLLAGLGRLSDGEVTLLASMYLSAKQRFHLVGPSDCESRRDAWLRELHGCVPDNVASSLRGALEGVPSDWRVAGRTFARSLRTGESPVIFGMGQNGRDALMGACEVCERVWWIDDRADASVPASLTDRCVRLSRDRLHREHVVLITPSDAAEASRDLRARGVRVVEHERRVAA